MNSPSRWARLSLAVKYDRCDVVMRMAKEVAVQQCTASGARSGSQGRLAELGQRVRQLELDLQAERLRFEIRSAINR